jgi:amidase
MNYKTARDMLADLAAKRVSARELLDAHMARHEALHTRLNAVVETDIPRARDEAQAIDDARAKGMVLGALAGLPMTIKDGFDVEGMPATAGLPALAHRSRDCADADLVAAVRRRGAIVWGKTNVPLMLGDFQTYNDIYGTTNNPYDLSRTPGGSSGGAAAALAAGIAPLEIGSDIGGSLRHPANFCGVLSLKPTWGALSLRGHVPPMPGQYCELDLGVAGPMARNAGDLKFLWHVLRGTTVAPARGVEGARIAVWDEEDGFPLAAEIRDGVRRAADALERAGAIVERAKPDIAGLALVDVYLALLWPIIAAGFPEELFKSFAAQREADEKAVQSGANLFSPELFRLRATASYRDVLAVMTKRQAMKDRASGFFALGWDAILCPISPVAAFTHRHAQPMASRTLDVDGIAAPYLTMMWWIALATALHLPAIAVPAGQTADGLPVGVQFVGAWDHEDRLFDLATALENQLGGFRPPAL